MNARNVVVRTIARADRNTVDGLAAFGTATVHEAIGRRGFPGPQLRPIQQGTRLAGTAVTVSCHPGDNLMIHAAVEVCQEGDVLVVTTTAPGVRALVTDAGVRDTAELREMGFAVWSQYVSCQGTVKASPGSVNVPVVLGGQVVSPGDVVCCDDDGVVVVAREEAGWALDRSSERAEKEGGTRARLVAGELGVDIYGLRATLAALGVEYVG
jgi:4-hydroxy-4-methyl-2-oxoglutarate aldolase